MHPREKAAIAATLSDAGLLDRVRAVAGGAVGDPLNNPHDSVKLREQFRPDGGVHAQHGVCVQR